MKLSQHARTELLILTALVLGSCEGSPYNTASKAMEKADIAYRQSIEGARASSAMVDRVERLEARVEELEDRLVR